MEKGEHFSAKGVAKMCGCQAAKKKRIGEISQKLDAGCFCQRKLFLGHPCIPRVRVNKGGDKRPSLRKKGRSWCEGRGGGRGRDRYKA